MSDVNYPDIKIKLNGYTACALLGKARVSTHFSKGGKVLYLVKATTPVEKQNERVEMDYSKIKAHTEEGYLVYFSNGVSGWFELMPLTDKRFSKYEEELLNLIEECSR